MSCDRLKETSGTFLTTLKPKRGLRARDFRVFASSSDWFISLLTFAVIG